MTHYAVQHACGMDTISTLEPFCNQVLMTLMHGCRHMRLIEEGHRRDPCPVAVQFSDQLSMASNPPMPQGLRSCFEQLQGAPHVTAATSYARS